MYKILHYTNASDKTSANCKNATIYTVILNVLSHIANWCILAKVYNKLGNQAMQYAPLSLLYKQSIVPCKAMRNVRNYFRHCCVSTHIYTHLSTYVNVMNHRTLT